MKVSDDTKAYSVVIIWDEPNKGLFTILADSEEEVREIAKADLGHLPNFSIESLTEIDIPQSMIEAGREEQNSLEEDLIEGTAKGEDSISQVTSEGNIIMFPTNPKLH